MGKRFFSRFIISRTKRAEKARLIKIVSLANKNSTGKGFTLIELIVVIAIVAVLAGLIIIRISNITCEARDARRKAAIDQINKATNQFIAEGGNINSGLTGINLEEATANGPVFTNPPNSKYPNDFLTGGKYPQDPKGGSYAINTSPNNVFDVYAPNASSDICPTNIASSPETVTIGTQVWMKYNMNVDTMVNGSQNQGTSCSSIQKYCYNNDENNCTTYGGLYQWDQAMCGSSTEGAQGICPTGFHIPTDAEWYTLENYLKDAGQSCSATRLDWGCSSASTKLKPGGSLKGFLPASGARPVCSAILVPTAAIGLVRLMAPVPGTGS